MSLDKKLIAIYLQDGEQFGKSLKEVQSDYFHSPYNKIHLLLKNYFINHKKLPSIDIIEDQLYKQRDKIFENKSQAEDIILNLRAEATLIDKADVIFLTEEIKKRKSYAYIETKLPEAVAAAKEDDLIGAADLMQQVVNSIKKTLTNDTIVHSSNHDYVDEVLERYNSAESSPDLAWGVKLGFNKLDQATFGMKSGEMLVVAARHGNGKSIFLLSAAVNIFKQGYNVVYVSLEMPTEQMWQRAVACYTGLPIRAISEATLTPEQKIQFLEGMKQFAEAKNRFEIIDTPHITVPTISSELDAIIEKHRPDVLIVDYLGIIRPSVSGLQDNLAQASVTEDLRALARQKRIPVLTAVQLNREPGKGKGKTKDTSRLSRSDVIGASADVVLQIEEVDTDDAITKLSDKIKIYVIKNRKGQAPFTFEVRKNFTCGQFLDWDSSEWKSTN